MAKESTELAVRGNQLRSRIESAMTRMDLRERLAVISEGFSYLAKVHAEQTAIQTRALMVIMRDRASRAKNG